MQHDAANEIRYLSLSFANARLVTNGSAIALARSISNWWNASCHFLSRDSPRFLPILQVYTKHPRGYC